MTEKRFKAHIFDDGVNERYHDGIIDNEDNDDAHVIVNYQYISNLLNKLHEENEQLKNSDTITDLQVQIMKLKSKNKRIHEFESRYRERNLKLEKENKELKRTIREDYEERKKVVNKYVDKIKEVEKENKELKTVLKKTLKQLYNAQTSQIYEYSSNITEETQELKEHFKEKYGKYGWKE